MKRLSAEQVQRLINGETLEPRQSATGRHIKPASKQVAQAAETKEVAEADADTSDAQAEEQATEA